VPLIYFAGNFPLLEPKQESGEANRRTRADEDWQNSARGPRSQGELVEFVSRTFRRPSARLVGAQPHEVNLYEHRNGDFASDDGHIFIAKESRSKS